METVEERLAKLERMIAQSQTKDLVVKKRRSNRPSISKEEWEMLSQQAEGEGVTLSVLVRQKLGLNVHKQCDRCGVLLSLSPTGRMRSRKFCDNCRVKDWLERQPPEKVRANETAKRCRQRDARRMGILMTNGVHTGGITCQKKDT